MTTTSESVLVGSANPLIANTVASFTGFSAIGGATMNFTAEASQKLKFRGGTSTLKNFRINCPTNARATATSSRIRKNTADSALVVTITGSTTGNFSDLSNNASFADGDLWDFSFFTGSGTGSLVQAGMSLELVQPSQAFTQLASSYTGDIGVSGAAATGFYAVAGTSLNTSENLIQIPMLESATLSNLQVLVTTNTSSSAATARSRKNGANGSQSVSIMAATTGLFEDSSNTDAVGQGDLINASVTSGATSTSIKLASAAMKYVGSVHGRAPAFCNDNGFSLPAGTTAWGGLLGVCVELTTAESAASFPAPFAGSASNLTITVSSNASTTNAQVTWRKGGVGGNQAISITAGTTGAFADSSHSDSFVGGDLLTIQATGATTGAIGLVSNGLLISGPVVTSATPGSTQISLAGVTPTTTGAATAAPSATQIAFTGLTPATQGAAAVSPVASQMMLTGVATSINQAAQASLSAGLITLTGVTPTTTFPSGFNPSAGQVALSGASPSTTNAGHLSPSASQVALNGGSPLTSQTATASVSAGSINLGGAATTLSGATTYGPVPNQITLAGGLLSLINGGSFWTVVPSGPATWTKQAADAAAWTVVPPTSTTWH